MITRTFFLLGTLLIPFLANAAGIPKEEARRAGINFYYEHIRQYHPVDHSSLKTDKAYTVSENGVNLYYIFTFVEKGFVIVSATDLVKPILAYSFDGFFDPDDRPPQFDAWMDQYKRQILYAVDRNEPAAGPVRREWDRLLSSGSGDLLTIRSRNVQPFIYSRWNQNTWYNEGCPADPGGPGGHAWAGCVPTAMGQIMYYYLWPEQGTGSYSYYDSTYGMLQADFSSTQYLWDNMKNSISSSNPGISQLLYHLGVSCDLVYGPNGSGMYNHKSAYALRTYFKYSPQTQYLFRDSTSLDWDSVIIAHLERRMPLYYAGWSVPNINGHAFVCDGYQDSSYFHFNFGWGGSSDGYFYLDELTPGGNTFNLAQELIINIFPDTASYSWPPFCSGKKTLKFREGSLTDGSGPVNNYFPHSICEWLIDPQTQEDSITTIKLTFDYLDAGGDEVTVYDGDTTTAPLLGQFNGNTTPPPLVSTGNRLLVRFTSDIGPSSSGWSATYTTTSPKWCNAMTTLTTDTAELTDGSLGFNYNNSTTCIWRILPEHQEGKPLTVSFLSFDTDPKDTLQLYDLDNTSVPLAKIAGHYEPGYLPPDVTSPGGKMFIVFRTDGSVTGKGWSLYYPKPAIGIPERDEKAVRIYPNPACDRILIDIRSDSSHEITLEIIGTDGRRFGQETRKMAAGSFRKEIDISPLPDGIYIVKITTGQDVLVEKLVVK